MSKGNISMDGGEQSIISTLLAIKLMGCERHIGNIDLSDHTNMAAYLETNGRVFRHNHNPPPGNKPKSIEMSNRLRPFELS